MKNTYSFCYIGWKRRARAIPLAQKSVSAPVWGMFAENCNFVQLNLLIYLKASVVSCKATEMPAVSGTVRSTPLISL